jgi:hypothetical protein
MDPGPLAAKVYILNATSSSELVQGRQSRPYTHNRALAARAGKNDKSSIPASTSTLEFETADEPSGPRLGIRGTIILTGSF